MKSSQTVARPILIASIFVLAAIVCITYQPGLRQGLYLDDYYNIERAGRIEFNDAARQIFDPRVQTLWYRPLQGLQFFIEYNLFRANSDAYHYVSIAYHLINVLLVYAIVARVSKKWRLGFAAAFFYATFTVYISGVNWIGIVEPLLGVFYLASILGWWNFLETGRARDYVLTLIATILALMSKQTALTLPVIFFLMDWWLARNPIHIPNLIRRYAPFALADILFAVLQSIAPSTATFTGWFGWKLGPTMLAILWEYLTLLFVPWGAFPSIDLNPPTVGNVFTYAWVVIVLILLAFAWWRTRSRVLLLLSVFTLITLIPVSPFPFLEHRYVYLPIISSAILLGWLLQRALRWSPMFAVAALGLAALAIGNGVLVQNSALEAAEWTRSLRVPYRDIERVNPTFPPDTLLYFIDPITPTEGGLSGMFFLRYGKDIAVKNWTQSADFARHNAAWVYYFDAQRRPQKIDVDKNARLASTPALPIDVGSTLRLEGAEVPQTKIKRGTPLVFIAYWRALAPMPENYNVFAHLVDRNDKIVAQYDGAPRKGQAPTSEWRAGLVTTDVILLAIDASVPTGAGYRLRYGLYDAQTGARVPIAGTPDNAVQFDAFDVIE